MYFDDPVDDAPIAVPRRCGMLLSLNGIALLFSASSAAADGRVRDRPMQRSSRATAAAVVVLVNFSVDPMRVGLFVTCLVDLRTVDRLCRRQTPRSRGRGGFRPPDPHLLRPARIQLV